MTTLALYLTHVTLLLYLDATQLTKRLATENLVMFEFKGKKEHYNNWDNYSGGNRNRGEIGFAYSSKTLAMTAK